MQSFRIRLRMQPENADSGAPIEIGGQLHPTLALTVLDASFSVTFESALDNLDKLPQLHTELDGAFVWRGRHDSGDWQIDGHLYDRADRLFFVELSGQLPKPCWPPLLASFGIEDPQPLVVELVNESAYVTFQTFQELLSARHGTS